VEGVAHNLGWLLPHVEAFTGERIEEIGFMGGAARSSAWAQILADVLDRRVFKLEDPELGAARAMAIRSFGPEPRDIGMISSGFEPTPDRRALYDARQTQFEAAYAALLPISEALS
jgi:sugar (pentulose or hexulose) kinase